MPSKPPKLTITVSGPIDSGKTHLLIKLQEFLVQTYGTDVRIKTDPLTMTRYDGHEHGPARLHRGTEIVLASQTVDAIKVVLDPYQQRNTEAVEVRSAEHGLMVNRHTGSVYQERGVARVRVMANVLTPTQRRWVANVLKGTHIPINPYANNPGFIHNETSHISMETLTKDVYSWTTMDRISLDDLKGSVYAWARLFGARPLMPRRYIGNDFHHLSLRLPRCSLVDSRSGETIEDWNTLSEPAFDWVLGILRDEGHTTIAELREYRRRPYLLGPIHQEEQHVPKILQPKQTWFTRLKGFLLGRPPTTQALDELKVTKTGVEVPADVTPKGHRPMYGRSMDLPPPGPPTNSNGTQLVGAADDIPESATTQAELDGRLYVAQATTDAHLAAHAERLDIDLPGPDETGRAVVNHLVLLDAQGNPAQPVPMHDLLNDLDKQVHVAFGMTPAEMGIVPIEVDDFTLTNDKPLTPDECGLALPLYQHHDEVEPHDVTAATQEVIDRLGGIVPDHHGHARKVMPLDGPTGKKSTYNSRATKPARKKKPRK